MRVDDVELAMPLQEEEGLVPLLLKATQESSEDLCG
jgi:hypothetical protein